LPEKHVFLIAQEVKQARKHLDFQALQDTYPETAHCFTFVNVTTWFIYAELLKKAVDLARN
jgi:hypothetical protein